MSEANLQVMMQTELLRITGTFSSGDVVINDWSILDGPNANAPYVNIQSSDTVSVENIQQEEPLTRYTIPFTVVVKFDDWDTARAALQTVRQTVIDWLKDTASFQDANGRLAWGLRSIRSLEPVSEIYDKYVENTEEALPVFLAHKLGAVVEEII